MEFSTSNSAIQQCSLAQHMEPALDFTANLEETLSARSIPGLEETRFDGFLIGYLIGPLERISNEIKGRLCKDKDEPVDPIVRGCSKIAQSGDKNCPNKVAKF